MRTLTRGRVRLLIDYQTIPPAGELANVVAEGPAIVRHADAATDVYRLAQHRGLVPRDREAFAILALNSRHAPIGFHVVSVGSLDSAPVHPREVFRPALLLGAGALIVMHHHPSGDATPSVHDRTLTDRLTEAGELLGIGVLDHLVLGATRFFSFSDGAFQPLRPLQLPSRGQPT